MSTQTPQTTDELLKLLESGNDLVKIMVADIAEFTKQNKQEELSQKIKMQLYQTIFGQALIKMIDDSKFTNELEKLKNISTESEASIIMQEINSQNPAFGREFAKNLILCYKQICMKLEIESNPIFINLSVK